MWLLVLALADKSIQGGNMCGHIMGQSGKIQLGACRDGAIDRQGPSVRVTMDAVGEKTAGGSAIQKKWFNSFAPLSFTFHDIEEVELSGIPAKKLVFTADVEKKPVGRLGQVNVDTYFFDGAGTVSNAGGQESFEVGPGSMKFAVSVNDWAFCDEPDRTACSDVGAFVDLEISVTSTPAQAGWVPEGASRGNDDAYGSYEDSYGSYDDAATLRRLGNHNSNKGKGNEDDDESGDEADEDHGSYEDGSSEDSEDGNDDHGSYDDSSDDDKGKGGKPDADADEEADEDGDDKGGKPDADEDEGDDDGSAGSYDDDDKGKGGKPDADDEEGDDDKGKGGKPDDDEDDDEDAAGSYDDDAKGKGKAGTADLGGASMALSGWVKYGETWAEMAPGYPQIDGDTYIFRFAKADKGSATTMFYDPVITMGSLTPEEEATDDSGTNSGTSDGSGTSSGTDSGADSGADSADSGTDSGSSGTSSGTSSGSGSGTSDGSGTSSGTGTGDAAGGSSGSSSDEEEALVVVSSSLALAVPLEAAEAMRPAIKASIATQCGVPESQVTITAIRSEASGRRLATGVVVEFEVVVPEATSETVVEKLDAPAAAESLAAAIQANVASDAALAAQVAEVLEEAEFDLADLSVAVEAPVAAPAPKQDGAPAPAQNEGTENPDTEDATSSAMLPALILVWPFAA